MKILNVVGARPNFMKMAPIYRAYHAAREAGANLEPKLVHTGQHYDKRMSHLFFDELGIPNPDINLEVGSATHAKQTAAIMVAFEEVVEAERPDAVLVVGDVNSTIACGLVASKLGIRLIHVEAGLRSFDRTMPEEINRVLTDSISDLLFCTEQSGVDNLQREGVASERVFLTGNVMVDTLLANRERANESSVLRDHDLTERGYAVVTLHRPANVDDPEVMTKLLDVFDVVQEDLDVVFPIHPRTAAKLEAEPFAARVRAMKRLKLLPPVGYLDFVHLVDRSRVVLTDSGGIQEETTIMGVPCLTLRDNTERPITITHGTNHLVGRDPDRILRAYREVMQGTVGDERRPPLWDGKAAERTVEVLLRELG